jgi:hypothetical protein
MCTKFWSPVSHLFISKCAAHLSIQSKYLRRDTAGAPSHAQGAEEDVDDLQGGGFLTGNGELVEQADFAENE